MKTADGLLLIVSAPSGVVEATRFLLRIEDADRERSSTANEAAILDALHWLGLSWGEGPNVGDEARRRNDEGDGDPRFVEHECRRATRTPATRFRPTSR